MGVRTHSILVLLNGCYKNKLLIFHYTMGTIRICNGYYNYFMSFIPSLWDEAGHTIQIFRLNAAIIKEAERVCGHVHA